MKKFLISLLVIAAVGGGVAWSKRADILIALVKYTTSQRYADVAPNREVPWQKGPAAPAATVDERPPNIVLIVADDLGYNDISTFGGGVGGPGHIMILQFSKSSVVGMGACHPTPPKL